ITNGTNGPNDANNPKGFHLIREIRLFVAFVIKKGKVMARMVNCVKLGRELPGLSRPPFPVALGRRVFENISQEAWQMWQAQSALLINHYGLTLRDPAAQKFLMEQLEEFF